MSDDRLGWVRWPLVARAAAAGTGLGSIYGVATGDFVFGLIAGAMMGIGFAVGRSYTS
ncbi:hypothetical protein NDI56_07695 [Haloarcula sp. S1CR25-12]|uniref:Uncharacterized protein n=1 Tax=Haloarcula saliterrae TaxID=2950534 RepID=A0ABU2FAH7_9EURY|nr:hypothetical protein [Haloarcula sp. S1CR25-12]MDS0259274.1 hypothetical protein [Haloarcula sp. S1CR25-12]